ncbi:MAG: glutamine-hydrolyzing carbamoyl-phosphate synthase small subunit, partial [Desulfovibrionaceae bacterium]|nr:glutamine-hydrolyzing carbamoyl-phosphate synthase small subunit [Desulfovibrionaceae bacterium]
MKALLVLEDGFTLEGRSFTGDFETGGEVIFTTSMGGYQGVLTDPSCHNQMVCMTYPLIGNYGITAEDMESAAIHCAALLVKECCKIPSNWRSVMSLPDFLAKHGKPGVEGLDTRALTRHLRRNGAMRGIISTREDDPQILKEKALALPPMQGNPLMDSVAAQTPWAWVNGKPHDVALASDGGYAWQGTGLPVLVYDYGCGWSLPRLLLEAGFEPLMVPPGFSLNQAKATGARGVLLSTGPGDPAAADAAIAVVQELISALPVAGIGLGHQLIARALGAKTAKLPFGHHGSNHPVRDTRSGRIEITTQNHGFHVILDAVPDVEATHINLNDQTVEGLRHTSLPVIGQQYQPGPLAGMDDTAHLFSRFRLMLDGAEGA